MHFEFVKSMNGFTPQQEIKLNLIKHRDEHYLMCKCQESCDCPGIIRTVNLSQLTTYTLEVTGFANNSRTYLHVMDLQGHALYKDKVFLPKEKKTVTLEFTPRSTQIRIGILMGADSIVTSGDYFMISNIDLQYSSQKEYLPGSSDLRITRVFETVRDLEREVQDPIRSNGTSMELGEFSILKGLDKGKGETDHLYILSRKGLRYVCGIGDGLPGFFPEQINGHPGKTLPVYEKSEEAEKDLRMAPDKFYEPHGDYLWSSFREQVKGGDIYLYLDKAGYVRWLPYQTNQEKEQSIDKKKENVESEKSSSLNLIDF